MKKVPTDPISLEIKSLSKSYKNINRENIRILHQFCQFDYRRTNKVVCMANEMKNPVLLIQSIIKKPQQSEELLSQLQRKYEKIYGPDVQEEMVQKTEVEGQAQIIPKLGYNFFQDIPNDCVMRIMEYLQPYSFMAFSFTSKSHYQIGKSEAKSEYYKNLCMKVFKMITLVFPAKCRFEEVKDYVLERPNQYGPNTRNAVQNNLRRYIWNVDMNSFALESNYYKSYGSYENLYKKCPRLNYNGYYVCRQKIVRIGQRNQKYPIAPIHVIYYYRYFRFFEDGTVIYHVRSKRLKSEDVINFLSRQLIEDKQQVDIMLGQFIHFKNQVLIRSIRNKTVFSYDLQIRSQDGKISNELVIKKYTLDLINDHQQIKQVLYLAKPIYEDKIFEYCYNPAIAEQNSPTIQACSL